MTPTIMRSKKTIDNSLNSSYFHNKKIETNNNKADINMIKLF